MSYSHRDDANLRDIRREVAHLARHLDQLAHQIEDCGHRSYDHDGRRPVNRYGLDEYERSHRDEYRRPTTCQSCLSKHPTHHHSHHHHHHASHHSHGFFPTFVPVGSCHHHAHHHCGHHGHHHGHHCGPHCGKHHGHPCNCHSHHHLPHHHSLLNSILPVHHHHAGCHHHAHCHHAHCHHPLPLRLGGLIDNLNFQLTRLLGHEVELEVGEKHEKIRGVLCNVGADFLDVNVKNKGVVTVLRNELKQINWK